MRIPFRLRYKKNPTKTLVFPPFPLEICFGFLYLKKIVVTKQLEEQGDAFADQTAAVDASMKLVQADIGAVKADVAEVKVTVAENAAAAAKKPAGKSVDTGLNACADLQDASSLEPSPGHYFVKASDGAMADTWCDYQDGELVSFGGDSKTKASAGSGCAFLADKFATKLATSKSTTFYAKDPRNKDRITPVFCDKTGAVAFAGGTTVSQATVLDCAGLAKAYKDGGIESLFENGVYWSRSAGGAGPMKCTKSGSTWSTESSGAHKGLPAVGSADSAGCAKIYRTFKDAVDIPTQHFYFASKAGATPVAVLCQVGGGTMKAVNDGKTEGKPLSSCDAAYKLLPHLVMSGVVKDNEFYISTNGKVKLTSCTRVNGRIITRSLWAGAGTAKDPYTEECNVAATLADARFSKAAKTHYAWVKLGSAKAVLQTCEWMQGRYESKGTNSESKNALTGTCNDMVQAGAQGVLPDGNYWFKSTDTSYTGGSTFQTWCNLNSIDKKGFSLIAKFSKNHFCYYSSNWRRNEYNQGASRNNKMPGQRTYDTLNEAYGRMAVKGLYFTGHRNNDLKKASYIGFEKAACPRKLITTQDVKITTYPNWNTWMLHFGSGRQWGPQFMRNARWELASKSYKNGASQRCRSEGQGSTRNPSGCGKKCVFCFQAGDGNCCHAGCGHHYNDVSFGLGLSSSYCGGGDGGDCSASGNWADSNNKVIVWASD